MTKKKDIYNGFEQGPIRPPSEAYSLLLRLTRNCPWNFCTFCPVYKGKKFSLRSVENIKKDIEIIYKYISQFKKNPNSINEIKSGVKKNELTAFQAAYHWFFSGMESIFLQDANSFIMKPDEFIEILKYIRKHFPNTKRVTSYARSQTVSKIADTKIKEFAKYGLNRVHIGMESGSDNVLKFIRKGTTKKAQIEAGKKIKNAGMELSEYFMPGVGGVKYSKKNAIETADALNQINPDFIRLRTLAIPNHTELFTDWQSGKFEKCSEIMVVKEIKTFIEHLDGITSLFKSDHTLNLFQDLEGKFPEDKNRLIEYLDEFLNMDKEEQMIYQMGRRFGYFNSLYDIKKSANRDIIKNYCIENKITPDNVEDIIKEIMKSFV